LAAARRIVEADEFMRAGLYDGWLPHLYENKPLLFHLGCVWIEGLGGEGRGGLTFIF